MLYTWSVSGERIIEWNGYLYVLQISLNIAGILIFLLAAKEYDMLQFAGIRQIISGSSHRVLSENAHIKDAGILSVMRHPFYTAVFIFLWARDMSAADLIVSVILSVYVVIGTLLEERKLVAEFGDEYVEYRKKVGMYFSVRRR